MTQPINPLQKHSWMLRIPVTQMEQGITYLKRIPDPMPGDESPLLDAMNAMENAIWNIQQWCERNGVDLGESMRT